MSEADDAVALRDPDTMSLEDLRDEVWFWRTEAAASLHERRIQLRLARERGGRGVGLLKREIERLRALLTSALAGELHEGCPACGEPIRPGDACLSDVEMGQMHAMCPIGGRVSTVRPGDRVYMEPEAIVWEGEGPKPDHLIAFSHERLYTTAQVAEAVAGERGAV